MALRPLKLSDINRTVTLTDLTNLDLKQLQPLPSDEVTSETLEKILSAIDLAGAKGEVLFMDQRQLLTFGYVDVPLVPEYDKKVLINNAMSEDARYFERLYSDLAARRFSLIITSPLRTPIKDSSYQFGEENNAWVKWVSNPVLCYYEEIDIFKEANIQLLVPKSEPVDCSAFLP